MREGMMDDCGYHGFEECCRHEDCCKDAYEQGRLDERADWECAAGELIVKYADDVYEALPEVVEQIRKDAIDEFVELYEKFCNSDIACGSEDCVGKFCPRCFRDNFMEQVKEHNIK